MSHRVSYVSHFFSIKLIKWCFLFSVARSVCSIICSSSRLANGMGSGRPMWKAGPEEWQDGGSPGQGLHQSLAVGDRHGRSDPVL